VDFRSEQLTDTNQPSTNEPIDPQPEPANQAPLTAKEPSVAEKIVIGRDGLRAGWSLLIFVALLAVFLTGVGAIVKALHLAPVGAGGGDVTAGPTILTEAIPFLLTLLAAWIMSKIEKRPAGVYGLGGQKKASHFLAGLGWGVFCLSVLVVTLWKTGLLVFESRLLFGARAFEYGGLWLVGFLMVGLLEEYLTRGYLMFTLTRGLAGIYASVFETKHSKAIGFWTAAVALSIIFGLGHGKNPGESPIGLLAAGLAGLVFCLSLWRTGSLWWAIGFHASWDWAQSFLYGVADSGLMVKPHLMATHPVGKALMSGGTTGPEGSVFVLPVLALASLIIVYTLPRKSDGGAA